MGRVGALVQSVNSFTCSRQICLRSQTDSEASAQLPPLRVMMSVMVVYSNTAAPAGVQNS